MSFSRRSAFGAPTAFARAVAAARITHDLAGTNPAAAGLRVEGPLDRLASDAVRRHAPAPFGQPAAREAVAASIGAPTGRVVLTASTSEAYGLLFELLCDPGDAVLIPQPSYPLFDVLARLAGVALLPYPLHYAAGRWWLDTEALAEAARDPRAKAAIAVSPNNPTGTLLGAGEQDALEALGLPLIVDEVFQPYPLDAPPRSARRGDGDGLRFLLGGLSKSAGLPQMKLGWVEVEGEPSQAEEALGRLAHLMDARLSVGAPVQAAAAQLLERGAELRARIQARLAESLAVARDTLAGSPLSPLPVDGGWSLMLRVPRDGPGSDERWARAALREGIRVQPGFLYDAPDGHLVVSLLTPPERLREGLARLRALDP
ncbi:MAG TPA: pyridoxal phosphate-dependent aminotransferase [Polyangiaceae bacterium LLY-WYZ-15_(1-7)]|nr:aminotransferase [Myxococcales bacterium]MAT28851.1 aminotransferase [Sandaracinus sp.]HJL05352.1 pyridoxal phosphate-dependent aminotransferase [Polyangiaceae bacterium LLY-WYZ-15_(1-7)]HJL07057.1 pyridoxal phosphate-dependent aminotransferase [Polyangiaceae bacterium LLY-WYZ-15_(1-7)]HJL31985.1 pyridoxal phosphate-dependent aminotransferase [Polyangiaceae bacterium LLY-WYZ-15_(1-7)]